MRLAFQFHDALSFAVTLAPLPEPTYPRPLPGGEQAFVRVHSVPLLGGVRRGFMVPMHAQARKEALQEHDDDLVQPIQLIWKSFGQRLRRFPRLGRNQRSPTQRASLRVRLTRILTVRNFDKAHVQLRNSFISTAK